MSIKQNLSFITSDLNYETYIYNYCFRKKKPKASKIPSIMNVILENKIHLKFILSPNRKI